MNLRIFDRYCSQRSAAEYWHLDICIKDGFSEEKLFDFYCKKSNIANCLKIFNVCNFSMDVAISPYETYTDFENELRKAVPGISYVNSAQIDYLIK